MSEAVSFIASQPSAEAARVGVYILAAVIGLLVCGLVSLAKELRQEAEGL